MSDKDSMSGSDMELDDITEGAEIRVVQSSIHASILQQSLFKVIENKKESDNESDTEKNEIKSPVIDNDINTPESIKKEETQNEKNLVEKPKIEKKYSKAVQAILADIKVEKSQKIDIEKRFYEYQSKVSKKIEALKAERNEIELKECSFTPNTKKTDKRQEKPNFERFLMHVTEFEKKKREKIEKFSKEKLETDQSLNFKPVLSKKTLKLTKNTNSKEKIHERLYEEFKILKIKQETLNKEILDEYCPFKPTLNEQSALLKREGNINQRLFEISKEKAKEILVLEEKPKIYPVSLENTI